ncbi:MAG TPA: DNA repair protein RecO [Opitutaceae bacterium]|nr:DNA repair protein RecO [Opitutaceae bacterium]
MAEGRLIAHHDEAIVLRTWPFHEADLLVSLFTREQGKVKGVARHAMKSRRRFGGALEPGTQVRAHYTERPREELVRLDSFEIAWSPLTAPVDALRLAGIELVVEVVEEAMPELAAEDSVFRLAVAVLRAMEGEQRTEIRDQRSEIREQRAEIGELKAEIGEPGSRADGDAGLSTARTMKPSASVEMTELGRGDGVWVAVTYFCLWMNRLMGWWPELGHCAACGLDLRGQDVWWSPVADGVTCGDDRRAQSRALSAESVAESYRMGRSSLAQLMEEAWPRERAADLRVFAVGVLERHLERRLRSAAGLG